MTIREQFKRRVIELIHGLPYEHAMKKEIYENNNGLSFHESAAWSEIRDELIKEGRGSSMCFPITIGRVIQAFKNKDFSSLRTISLRFDGILYYTGDYKIICKWKLTKEDGFTEATDNDQTDETIASLLSILQ